MKTIMKVVIAALLLIPQSSLSATWQEISASISTMNQQGQSRVAMVEQLMKHDESDLKKALTRMRGQVKGQKQQLGEAQKQLAALGKTEQKLKQELAAEQEEIEGIQGTVLGAAKRLNDSGEESVPRHG